MEGSRDRAVTEVGWRGEASEEAERSIQQRGREAATDWPRPRAANSKAAEPIWPRRSELVTSFDKELNGLHNSLPLSPLALLSWAFRVKGLEQGGSRSGSQGAKAPARALPGPAPTLQGQKEAPAVHLLPESLPPGLPNNPTLASLAREDARR